MKQQEMKRLLLKTVSLLCALLCCVSAAGCSAFGALGEWAESVRAEQSQYQGAVGEDGMVHEPPPPIVRPGDGVGGHVDPAETEEEKDPAEITAETEASPAEEDPG